MKYYFSDIFFFKFWYYSPDFWEIAKLFNILQNPFNKIYCIERRVVCNIVSYFFKISLCRF